MFNIQYVKYFYFCKSRYCVGSNESYNFCGKERCNCACNIMLFEIMYSCLVYGEENLL